MSGGLGSESGSFDKIKAMQERFILGYGGYPLIGTREQIVDQLLELEQAGVGGMMVGFLDYVQTRVFGDGAPAIVCAKRRSAVTRTRTWT